MNYFKSLSPNANGSSSEAFKTFVLFSESTSITSMLPQRSLITCLHAPQGEINPFVSPAIAIALNFLSLSDIALNIL